MADTAKLERRRRARVRMQVKRSANGRPRLSVFRSNKYIYAQVIDDATGATVAAASSIEKDVKSGSNQSVASEVGNLATQTAKATEEISTQIAGIQTATNGSVEAIQGISSTISELNEIASGVAAAVEEQGAATQEIARNVEQAASGTQEVTNNITTVASEVDGTGEAAGRVQVSAGDLTKLSDQLANTVQGFLANVRTDTDGDSEDNVATG